MSPSASLPYEFRDIGFDNSGKAYVFAGTFNTNWNMDGLLFSTTNFSALTTIDTVTNVSGYFWSAQHTPDNDRVWFARGNEVYVYDATNTTIRPSIQQMSNLIKGSAIAYDSLNDLCYVGPLTGGGKRVRLRGYQSPIQRSNSPLAVALRAITKGRPEATPEEFAQARASLGK
jgi:hypothetical protein